MVQLIKIIKGKVKDKFGNNNTKEKMIRDTILIENIKNPL